MIRYCETTFDDYLTANRRFDLHAGGNVMSGTSSPPTTNLIFYGPAGVGKYTQMLKTLFPSSAASPPRDKKLSVMFNKQEYIFKTSTRHFEIDMDLLGCNSKLLWHEIFTQIMEIAELRTGAKHPLYIVCKNFHTIHSELLDIFYSYMQNALATVKYVLITEHLSFIPEDILNACRTITIRRPSKTAYQAIAGGRVNVPGVGGDIALMNIKYIKTAANFSNTAISTTIAAYLMNPATAADFNKLRNHIYNILTYHLEVAECIWQIMYALYKSGGGGAAGIPQVIRGDLYTFFKQYNNNYRPIYHLERLFLSLICPASGGARPSDLDATPTTRPWS